MHVSVLELSFYIIIGGEYYMAFPNNLPPQSLTLFVSTKESEKVAFSVVTLQGFRFSGTVKNTQTVQVDIPLELEVTDSTQREKGIKITTENDKQVNVFGQSYRNKSSGIFSSLPCLYQDIKEYEYYAVTSKDSTGEESAWLLLVGCENATSIKIDTDTLLLNEMETYLFSKHSDLTGMRVVSNKPISFFSGHQCDVIPIGIYFCDHMIEQLPNSALWGKEFMTAPLFGRTAPDIYTIVSSVPSTQVKIVCSNTTVTTKMILSPNNHETVTVPGQAFCSINSTHPVLVVQFASGQDADNTDSDPFMMNIPPLKHYSNDYVIVAPPQFQSSTIAIFVLPEYYEAEKIFVDAQSQGDSDWTSVLCSINEKTVCGYVTFVNVTEGQHRVYHRDDDARISVSVYGFSYHNGYGYSMLMVEPHEASETPFDILTLYTDPPSKGFYT